MEEIIKAIITVSKEERFFGNEIAQMIFNENQKLKDKRQFETLNFNLSKRELQILALIVQELNSIEIAEKLFLSKRTVEWHRKNMISKLNVKTTIGLVKFAIENGIN
jgi:DNA-binding NarL/FixJ family response regulator